MAKKKPDTTSTTTTKVKGKGKGKVNPNNERKQNVTFNNVTIPDPPKFHASKATNRHMLNCAGPGTQYNSIYI